MPADPAEDCGGNRAAIGHQWFRPLDPQLVGRRTLTPFAPWEWPATTVRDHWPHIRAFCPGARHTADALSYQVIQSNDP